MEKREPKVFKLTESQRRLFIEVERKHREEFSLLLRLIQEELGVDSDDNSGRFMLSADRTTLVEVLSPIKQEE
jgi:hypothetical protein